MDIFLINHIEVFISFNLLKRNRCLLFPFPPIVININAIRINIKGINFKEAGIILLFKGVSISQFNVEPLITAPLASIIAARVFVLFVSDEVFIGNDKFFAKTVFIRKRKVYVDVIRVLKINKLTNTKFIWLNIINSKI